MTDDTDGIITGDMLTREMIRMYDESSERWEAWQDNPDRWEFSGYPTWSDIVVREPQLQDLERDAVKAGQRDHHSYVTWYRQIKPRLFRIVGYEAENQVPPLQTAEVYDVVYQHLLRCYETEQMPEVTA